MKSILFSVAAFAASALAVDQNCGAAYIVEACLGSENGKLEMCGREDYVCRCNQYANVLTCFNNCPNDEDKFASIGQQEIFCGYASQFPSTAAAAPTKATGTGSSAPAVTTDAKVNEEESSSSSSTPASNSNANAEQSSPTSAAPSETPSTGAAADLVMNAGGLLAAVAGVVAAVL